MHVGNHNRRPYFGVALAAMASTSLLSQSARADQFQWYSVLTHATAAAAVTQLDDEPEAIFDIIPEQPTLGVPFRVDASESFDRPSAGPIASYVWNWGDGTPNSTGVTAQHTYAAAGRYTITLTVTDADPPPVSDTAVRTVTIGSTAPPPGGGGGNRAPVADLVINPAEGDPGEEFTFDATGSSDADSDPVVYRFNFGDGNETEFESDGFVTHVYDEPGTYTVRLTVRDDQNASSDLTTTVRVLGPDSANRAPVALIATGPRTGAAPTTLSFDGRISYDLDGDPLAYEWTFLRDGAPYANQSGSVVNQLFSQPGSYSVSLEVSDGDGASSTSSSQTVTITAGGVPVEPPPPSPIPEPEPIPPSHTQRPNPVCGFGILLPMLACLMGLLGGRRLTRRRN